MRLRLLNSGRFSKPNIHSARVGALGMGADSDGLHILCVLLHELGDSTQVVSIHIHICTCTCTVGTVWPSQWSFVRHRTRQPVRPFIYGAHRKTPQHKKITVASPPKCMCITSYGLFVGITLLITIWTFFSELRPANCTSAL